MTDHPNPNRMSPSSWIRSKAAGAVPSGRRMARPVGPRPVRVVARPEAHPMTDRPTPALHAEFGTEHAESCLRCSGFGDYEGNTCRVCGGTGTKRPSARTLKAGDTAPGE